MKSIQKPKSIKRIKVRKLTEECWCSIKMWYIVIDILLLLKIVRKGIKLLMTSVKSYINNKRELIRSDSVFFRREDYPYTLEIIDDTPDVVKVNIIMDDKMEEGSISANLEESGEIFINCAVPKIGAAIGLKEPMKVAFCDDGEILMQFIIRNSYEDLFEITTSVYRNIEG